MSLLRILPIGGMGNVTQNMYCYEYEDELLIVDCGIGFPDMYMPGVDILIPDISYIKSKLEEGKKIVGMILTHGHDDHIAALPYLLPELPEFPIFGSPLTAGFAENRMKDGAAARQITVINDSEPFTISQYFSAQAFKVTHSVPDTRHYLITTPEGAIYHGADFKLDPTPVDGQPSDLAGIAKLAEQNILCMMVDCLRVERDQWTKSESTVGPAIEQAMAKTQGKFIITLMSSHLHRIQQTITAAIEHKRKIVFVGRSVEQNVEVALALKKINIPREMIVDKREINDHQDSQLCIIIAGSQGQEGSSLMRAVYGEHPIIQIKQNDLVVFSADAIPGNEIPYFGAIDELCRNGVHVLYPDVDPNLHQSGHASAPEQQELVGLIKPQFVMPIGGADRHRIKFIELVAAPLSITPERVLIPGHGDILGFEDGRPRIVDNVDLNAKTVDGKGIGDVGKIVLSDRRALSQAGIIVLVLPSRKGVIDTNGIEVISRGFVFMKEADEVISFIKKTTTDIVREMGKKAKNDEIKRAIEKRLGRELYKIIQREPMIVPVVVNI